MLSSTPRCDTLPPAANRSPVSPSDTWQTAVKNLLDQAREGDMEAFARLFEPLRPAVFAAACRLVGPQDAEDVVMDTFLKAWKALPGFAERSALKTWLIRIARNRALDLIRARQAAPLRSLDADAEREDGPPREWHDPTQLLPDEDVAGRELAGLVDTALRRVAEPHRTTLVMRSVDELSYSEIAAATGVNIGTVMSRLFNAKRKLRAAMAELEGLAGAAGESGP